MTHGIIGSGHPPAAPYLSARGVALQEGAPQRGRAPLVSTITARLSRYALLRGIGAARLDGLPYMWRHDVVEQWLAFEGRDLIRTHIVKVAMTMTEPEVAGLLWLVNTKNAPAGANDNEHKGRAS